MGAGSLENELGMRGREDRLVFVLLFLFWLLLNGKVTVEIILVGAAVSAALTCFAHRVLHISPQGELRVLRRLPEVFCYLMWLMGQILLSNIQVIGRILTPGKKQAPAKLIWFQPGTKGDLAKLALANSITLTPGTVTVSMGADMLCVYALDAEFGAGIKESAFSEKLKKLEEERHG